GENLEARHELSAVPAIRAAPGRAAAHAQSLRRLHVFSARRVVFPRRVARAHGAALRRRLPAQIERRAAAPGARAPDSRPVPAPGAAARPGGAAGMKPALIFLAVFSAASLAPAAGAEMVVQACFSPQGRCAAHILREIESAKKELLVAVYAFTSDDLAHALVQAKKRGVGVQVVIDREFDRANENSKGKFLDAQKISLRRVS